MCSIKIFYSGWMSEVDDNTVITTFKIVSLAIPGTVTVMDMYVLSDVRDLLAYQFLRYGTTPDQSSKFGYAASTLIVGLTILVIYVQTRIEMDRAKFDNVNDNDNTAVFYKISIIRCLVVMAFVIFGLWLFTTAFPHIFHIRDTSATGFVVVFAICPCIFIFNHQGMMTLSRSILCKQTSNLLSKFVRIESA